MANEEQQWRRKIILTHVIKELALIESTENRIPTCIRDYILAKYTLHRSACVGNFTDEEETDFLNKLENLIREKYELSREKEERTSMTENHKECFIKSYGSFSTAKREYLQAALQINSLLHDIIQQKEKYSDLLKEMSFIKQGEFEVLEKKLHFLKLQSLLKFFSENNALEAHFRLKEILKERLNNLQSQCNNLLDLSSKYNELKNNKTYMELLQLYRQLLKREMKLDYMIESI